MNHLILKTFFSIGLCIFLLKPSFAQTDVAQFLQDISVTIHSSSNYQTSEGSGVLINREIEGEKISFVLTCAHVIENLRKIKSKIIEGRTLKVIEFKDASIIKEIVESGRRVGEIKMEAEVIKYSSASDGHDLAVLMVRAKDYAKTSAQFYISPDKPIISIGTPLFHVGSLLGQMGANSMTSGIVSQVGRVENKFEFDQTTVTAFPGSSGGGVFLQDGRYMGMIVRGAGEGFNLIVPIRRILSWADEHGLTWLFDTSLETPPLKIIREMPLETSLSDQDSNDDSNIKNNEFSGDLPFLIRSEYK